MKDELIPLIETDSLWLANAVRFAALLFCIVFWSAIFYFARS